MNEIKYNVIMKNNKMDHQKEEYLEFGDTKLEIILEVFKL